MSLQRSQRSRMQIERLQIIQELNIDAERRSEWQTKFINDMEFALFSTIDKRSGYRRVNLKEPFVKKFYVSVWKF